MLPILINTELAAKALVETTLSGSALSASVFTGIDNEDKEAPAVICYASNAIETYYRTNVFSVTLELTVKEIAADTNQTNIGKLADTVFGSFLNYNTRVNNLTNNALGYVVYDVIPDGNTNTVSQDAWVQTLSLRIVCALT